MAMRAVVPHATCLGWFLLIQIHPLTVARVFRCHVTRRTGLEESLGKSYRQCVLLCISTIHSFFGVYENSPASILSDISFWYSHRVHHAWLLRISANRGCAFLVIGFVLYKLTPGVQIYDVSVEFVIVLNPSVAAIGG